MHSKVGCWGSDYGCQDLERMRTLMKEEEKRQREHDAAMEVLRRHVFIGRTGGTSCSTCQMLIIISGYCYYQRIIRFQSD